MSERGLKLHRKNFGGGGTTNDMATYTVQHMPPSNSYPMSQTEYLFLTPFTEMLALAALTVVVLQNRHMVKVCKTLIEYGSATVKVVGTSNKHISLCRRLIN